MSQKLPSSLLSKLFRKDDDAKKGKKSKTKNDDTVASSTGLATTSAILAGTSLTGGESSQPETSPILAPQSAEKISTIPQPASSDQLVTTSNTVASDPPSLPEQLWDRAYDELKANESKLVGVYEKILSLELKEGDSSSVTSGLYDNTIEQTKLTLRRSQMRQLIQAGLKKTEKEAKVKRGIGNAMEVVNSAKDIIGSAIQTVPQAALAWTGVCFALQILLNPTEQTKANRDGIVHIISRMDWYWKLSGLLLKENTVDGGASADLRCELEKRIVNLYRTLLSYQMKSVCSYYRNRGLITLGDIIKLDDWNGNLKTVQDAENAVRQDSEAYNTEQIKMDLEQLVGIAKKKETKLQNIHLVLQDQVSMQMEREDNQCLQHLRLTDPRDDMTRIEVTKGGLLEDSYVWILSHRDFIDWRDGDETQLLWIKGDAGKGKTMLLIGIVKELQQLKSTHSDLVSYFFCEGVDARLNNATAVLRGLIYQLVVQQPLLISHLRKRYDIAGRQLFEDVNAFVALSNIFTEMVHDTRLTRVYLVVDALDECESGLLKLLDFIVQNVSTSFSRVKWLLSSRNWHDIEERLRINDSLVKVTLELNAESVSAAVDAYIDHKVSELDRRKQYKELRVQITEELRQKADGTFLWVALVCKELESVGSYEALAVLHEIPSELKGLYDRMMCQIKKLKRNDPKHCKSVLSTVILAYQPLHILELETLAGLPRLVPLMEIIKKCASFLTIRDDIVYPVHQSAKDYLTNDAETEIWPDGRTKKHVMMVSQSVDAMKKTLRRDLYDLVDPGCIIEQVDCPKPDPLIPIRYACLHWIDHLCEINNDLYDQVGLCDNGTIDEFLKNHFLHWLEALSLLKNISIGIAMIGRLENLLAINFNESQLLDLVQYERRFILYNRSVIENVPLQAYVSGLVFSPACSFMKEQWKKEEPEWIETKPIMQSKWSSCLQTLEGHSNWVTSVAFSHDSRRLASASDDGTVKIWDPSSGACLQTLEGHSDCGHVGGLLARLAAARVGLGRPHGQDLGSLLGRVPADARGPQQFGQVGGLLARLAAARVGLGRQHGQDLGSLLGRVPADARGPQRLGQVGGLLARLAAARVGVVRQHGQDLGSLLGRVPADARGPQRLGHVGGLLARLAAARVGVGRRHGQDLGSLLGRVPADARGPQQFGQVGGLLARLAAARVGVVRRHGQDLGSLLGRVPADARGPQRLGHVGGLLARLAAARVGVGRPHGQDLGSLLGRVPADARGPQRFGHVGGLLARLAAARVGLVRPHGQDLGSLLGRVPADARGWRLAI